MMMLKRLEAAGSLRPNFGDAHCLHFDFVCLAAKIDAPELDGAVDNSMTSRGTRCSLGMSSELNNYYERFRALSPVREFPRDCARRRGGVVRGQSE